MSDDMTRPPRRRMNPLLRQGLEFGPVAAFFVTLLLTNPFTATAVLMVLMTISAAVAFSIEGRVSALILFGLVTVLAFGGLTLLLQDEAFIKIRPSIYFTTLAAVLLGGLWFGRIFMKAVFEYAFRIDDAGWRKLTLRMGLFLLVLAVANYVVAMSFSIETWGAYKFFAVPLLMMAFMMAQTPLLMKHGLPDEPGKPDA
jgi:intracellular septation protein